MPKGPTTVVVIQPSRMGCDEPNAPKREEDPANSRAL
jgi:hypothetical protein